MVSPDGLQDVQGFFQNARERPRMGGQIIGKRSVHVIQSVSQGHDGFCIAFDFQVARKEQGVSVSLSLDHVQQS